MPHRSHTCWLSHILRNLLLSTCSYNCPTDSLAIECPWDTITGLNCFFPIQTGCPGDMNQNANDCTTYSILFHSPTHALAKALVSESHEDRYRFTETAYPNKLRQNSESQYKTLCYHCMQAYIHIYIYIYMGQVMKVRLSCYLVLLSNDSKTR